jgi:hypothetical protein
VVAPQVLLFPCPFLMHPNILYKSIHSSWVSCITFNKSAVYHGYMLFHVFYFCLILMKKYSLWRLTWHWSFDP